MHKSVFTGYLHLSCKQLHTNEMTNLFSKIFLFTKHNGTFGVILNNFVGCASLASELTLQVLVNIHDL